MFKKTFSGFMIVLLFFNFFILAFDVCPANADAQTVYINADGSVTPAGAPIVTSDNKTYNFAGNISYPTYSGIVVQRSNIIIDGKGYVIQGNQNENGLDLTSISNVTVKNMNIENFTTGISLSGSYTSIIGNNVTGNEFDGISVSSSSSNNISGNNIIANNGTGIDFSYSLSNSISGNNITNNYLGLIPIAGIYLFYSSNNSISGNNVAISSFYTNIGIGVYSSNNNSIRENKITNNYFGIYLSSSSNNSMSGNNITNNVDGIRAIASNNSISGNNIVDNYVDGIITGSSGNSISGNNITGNEGFGILLSSNNSVSGNNITNNWNSGICLSSNNSVIIGNNIANNGLRGIYLVYSFGNEIYHNNFINNTFQVSSDGSANVWDNGYHSGGNYWSDYNGTDYYCGPYQYQIGSDGIGDTPYVIDANNKDNYPLMARWPITNWNPYRDSYSQINFASAWAEGNCYGLSSTEILYFMNNISGNASYPYLPAQDPSATWTSDLNLPTDTSTLNNASLAVMFHQVYDPNNVYIPPSSEKAEYNKLNETLMSGVPALLAMHGKWLGEDIYHAIVAYGLEVLPDGTVNIKVSDPNAPQQGEIANYNPSTQKFSYNCYYIFDKFEVVTPRDISNSWAPAPWWYFRAYWWYFGTYWWWHNWLSLSVTGYDIVIADKNVTIKSNGLIDKFTQMGNSQTFIKAIPGSSGIEEGNVQVYAIPTGTKYTISDPDSNQSTILITRVDNESGLSIGYGYLVNATATEGSLNFTATSSDSGLLISDGANGLNASVTCFSATEQGYSVSQTSNVTVDAMQTVNFTSPTVMNVAPAESTVNQGCGLPINVTITNIGAYDEAFNMTVCANETSTSNSTVIATFTNVTVGAGNSTTLTLTWDTTGLSGDYTISACVASATDEAGTVYDVYAGSTVTVQAPSGGSGGRMPYMD